MPVDAGVEVFRPEAALSDGLCAQSYVQPAREMENQPGVVHSNRFDHWPQG